MPVDIAPRARFELRATPLGRAAKVLLMIAPLAISHLSGIPICPYRLVMREPCPGCGLTRASESLFTFDWLSAYAMNPISFVVVPWALWLIVRNAYLYIRNGKADLNEPWTVRISTVLGVALIVIWAARRFGAFGGPVPV